MVAFLGKGVFWVVAVIIAHNHLQSISSQLNRIFLLPAKQTDKMLIYKVRLLPDLGVGPIPGFVGLISPANFLISPAKILDFPRQILDFPRQIVVCGQLADLRN
jgi:hypothetical protein